MYIKKKGGVEISNSSNREIWGPTSNWDIATMLMSATLLDDSYFPTAFSDEHLKFCNHFPQTSVVLQCGFQNNLQIRVL